MNQATLFTSKKSITLDVPGKFDELNTSQFLKIIRALYVKRSALSVSRVLLILFSLKWSDIRLRWMLFRTSFEEFENMLPLTLWLYEPEPLISKNLLPNFRHRFESYEGLQDGFANFKFGEFIFADTYFMTILSTEDEKLRDLALRKLIVTLWRRKRSRASRFFLKMAGKDPKALDGSYRRPLSSYTIAEEAERIKALKPEIKLACLIIYESWRRQIIKKFSGLFKKGESDNYTWAHVLREAADRDTTKYEKKMSDALSTVFFDLELKIQEAKEKADEAARVH